MGLFGIFSQKESVNKIQEYLNNGAVVLDVRTHQEWNEGHSEGAKHVVLNTIPDHLEEIKSLDKPVIAVCKSGGRSQSATDFLKQNGVDVINGGPWQNVDQYL
ncbi:rhodanese-like domain-containing protein [Pseudotenacibaculum haliotis]|uniref:Rhodanese-like domain-containing protein n=1 Tax=Pseudotenacibaculum haliotis TaxID=1862138 RepID=A0ABW5LUK0_9FLAO